MIDNIAYDMIENLEASKMVDFLRMMNDYKATLLMQEINKSESEDFSDDLPF
jgi:hypothetical protein